MTLKYKLVLAVHISILLLVNFMKMNAAIILVICFSLIQADFALKLTNDPKTE